VFQRQEVPVCVRLALAVPVAAALLAGGCDDTFISISSDGRIEVLVTSSGPGDDDDGFRVTVDDSTTQFLMPGGSVTLTGLSQGSHRVLLAGLAENCRVEGANPRPVVVTADRRASVTFLVLCERTTTGALAISVATTGDLVDTDGYLLVVGEAGARRIANSANETFSGLLPGMHLVMLKDVAHGCALEGGNPQPAVVVAGETAPVRLVVKCGVGTQ
jgi:hypothetical protein